jgi:hypothetical protein
MVQGAAIEALGVLGCLCTVDPAVMPRVLPSVKRLDRRSSAPADALLNLTVMRFFIDHQDHVVCVACFPTLSLFTVSSFVLLFTVFSFVLLFTVSSFVLLFTVFSFVLLVTSGCVRRVLPYPLSIHSLFFCSSRHFRLCASRVFFSTLSLFTVSSLTFLFLISQYLSLVFCSLT